MTASTTLRIGTRASRLALAQARIASETLARYGTPRVETVSITTRGDVLSARRPRGRFVDGDGQFTRELERALLDRRVDLVVHSYKDLPTAPAPGLRVAAVLRRADPRDCLLTRDGVALDDVRFGGRVGTSSPRRAAQLAAVRSDLRCVPVRGNVESRLQRLQRGEYDALVLAAAGLDRLGIEVPAAARLPLAVMLPAPAQGALAVQVRDDDDVLQGVLRRIDDVPTRIAVEAERALLRAIGGGCLAPLGAYAEVEGSTLSIRAALEHSSGAFARAEASGPIDQSAEIVDACARRLREASAA